MKTPVFDTDRRIVGFLEHSEECKKRRDFFMHSRAVPHYAEGASIPVVTITGYHFEWAVIASSREANEAFYCDVLIADPIKDIHNVRGFTYFAEQYGKPKRVMYEAG